MCVPVGRTLFDVSPLQNSIVAIPRACASANSSDTTRSSVRAVGPPKYTVAATATHPLRFPNAGKLNVCVLGRPPELFIVVELQYHRKAVGTYACYRPKYSERRYQSATTAVGRQFHDRSGVEIVWVGSKHHPGGMCDPVIDRQQAQVSSASMPARCEQSLQCNQHALTAVTP